MVVVVVGTHKNLNFFCVILLTKLKNKKKEKIIKSCSLSFSVFLLPCLECKIL